MLSTSLRSRFARRKNCGNETLPGASSLDRCSRKQRCISRMMWESRSASARMWSVGVRANAVTGPVFKAIKLGMHAELSILLAFARCDRADSPMHATVQLDVTNPKFELQQFDW